MPDAPLESTPAHIPAGGLARIRASEVGRYVYCARAWWLQRVMGCAPENRAALERGERRHRAHGRLVVGSSRQATWARWLLILALALLAAALLILSEIDRQAMGVWSPLAGSIPAARVGG
jgi:hypothetical protein